MRLAMRGVRGRRLRSWLTIVGVLIGIGAIVALIGIGTGIHQAVLSRFEEVGYDIVAVRPLPWSMNIAPEASFEAGMSPDSEGIEEWVVQDTPHLGAEEILADLPEVAEAKSIRSWIGRVSSERSSGHLRTVAASDGFFETFRSLAGDLTLADGRAHRTTGEPEVVLGARTAQRLDVSVGDEVVIDSVRFVVSGILAPADEEAAPPASRSVAGSTFIEGLQLSLTALLPVLPEQYDDALFVPIEQDRSLWGGTDQATTLVRIDPSTPVATAMDAIRTALTEAGISATPTSVEDLAEDIQATVQLVKVVLTCISAVALIVGAIGLMNTMYASVLERRREIGILKAVGARSEQVLLMFLLDSGLMGLMGGILGVAAGTALGHMGTRILGEQLGLTSFSPAFPLQLLLGALALSFVLGALSGAWPAWQASRLDPVRAIADV
jgi:putative ABC transport system permease protein